VSTDTENSTVVAVSPAPESSKQGGQKSSRGHMASVEAETVDAEVVEFEAPKEPRIETLKEFSGNILKNRLRFDRIVAHPVDLERF